VIIIGERLNATNKTVGEALRTRDAEFVRQRAREQTEVGADYLDCNAGRKAEDEIADMQWLVRTAREATDLPFCIDSPSPKAMAAALEVYEGPPPILNSATADPEHMAAVIDLALQAKGKLIALCMGKSLPTKEGDREACGQTIIDAASGKGIPLDDIIVDPVVLAVSSGPEAGPLCLKALRTLRERNPDVHFSAGVTNVSFGLPNRPLLNRTYLALLMANGLDAAIINPNDPQMMATVYAAEALLGIDDMCMAYIGASREGKLEV
jgi:cobalamin-dependent methionine synthase I